MVGPPAARLVVWSRSAADAAVGPAVGWVGCRSRTATNSHPVAVMGPDQRDVPFRLPAPVRRPVRVDPFDPAADRVAVAGGGAAGGVRQHPGLDVAGLVHAQTGGALSEGDRLVP
jgi:hypothetical protein